MPRGILLMGHGSPKKVGNDDFFQFVENYKRYRQTLANTNEIVEGCVIEHAQPDLDQGIALMAGKGVIELYCLPVILFEAGHVKLDIPQAILQGRKKYPHMNLIPGSAIGTHPLLLEIIKDRIGACLPLLHKKEDHGSLSHSGEQEIGLLFVGRGSLDPYGNSDLYKMARIFWESSHFKGIEVCYVGVTEPTIEDALLKMRALDYRQVILIPYFLFTGELIPRIQEKAKKFQESYPEMEIVVSDYLGHHPLIFHILDHRIREAKLKAERHSCYLYPYGPCELNISYCSLCLNEKRADSSVA